MLSKLRQKGEVSILALVLGGITIIGTFVGMGVRVGTIETKQENTNSVAIEAKVKAETALNQTTEIRNDIKWIKEALKQKGFSAPQEVTKWQESQ